jgi:hypothetical protein
MSTFQWQEVDKKSKVDDWVFVAKDSPQEDMVRLVTAVSEVQSILGENSAVKLGDVSKAVRHCNYDVAAAVEFLLSGAAMPQQAVSVPHPSAPPLPELWHVDQKRKCAFCEVLNPAANTVCFVCDSEMGPAPVVVSV